MSMTPGTSGGTTDSGLYSGSHFGASPAAADGVDGAAAALAAGAGAGAAVALAAGAGAGAAAALAAGAGAGAGALAAGAGAGAGALALAGAVAGAAAAVSVDAPQPMTCAKSVCSSDSPRFPPGPATCVVVPCCSTVFVVLYYVVQRGWDLATLGGSTCAVQVNLLAANLPCTQSGVG